MASESPATTAYDQALPLSSPIPCPAIPSARALLNTHSSPPRPPPLAPSLPDKRGDRAYTLLIQSIQSGMDLEDSTRSSSGEDSSDFDDDDEPEVTAALRRHEERTKCQRLCEELEMVEAQLLGNMAVAPSRWGDALWAAKKIYADREDFFRMRYPGLWIALDITGFLGCYRKRRHAWEMLDEQLEHDHHFPIYLVFTGDSLEERAKRKLARLLEERAKKKKQL